MINETVTSVNPSQKRKRGFTLTEIAIVLGIIGLILGAIWVAAAAVYNNQRVAHANTAILQMAQAVRGLYANANSTTGATPLTTDAMICAKAVPADLVNATCGTPGTMVSPFPGGVTTIVPDTDGNGFQISMTGVTRDACVALLMAVGGANRDPGLWLATGSAAASAAAATGTPIAVTATPVLAQGAIATGFGGCTAASFAPTGAVNFGFALKA